MAEDKDPVAQHNLEHRITVWLNKHGLEFRGLSDDGERFHYSDPNRLTAAPLWGDVSKIEQDFASQDATAS